MPSAAETPKAVVFDLFGTLVPGGTAEQRDGLSRDMADVLGVDEAEFAAAFRGTFGQRTLGQLGGVRATIRLLSARLGPANRIPPDDVLDEATRLRLGFTAGLLRETWALDALGSLVESGLVLGLVSDCSAEVPEVWADSALAPHFSATAFSCELRTHKPDPEMYLHTTRALGVTPEECVYVGDGGSHELAGARDLGMTAVLYQRADVTQVPEAAWSGLRVHDLAEVVSVGLAAARVG